MAPRLILFVALFLGILYGNALFAEDTLVTAQGRPPDSDTHALHRFIGPLTDRAKQ